MRHPRVQPDFNMLQERFMLKKHMTTCLFATALAAAPALAQTSMPSASGATDRPVATGSGEATYGSPAMQPAPGGPATGATGSQGTGMSQGTSAAPGSQGVNASQGPSTPSGSGASPKATAAGTIQPESQNRFMTQLQPDHLLASKLIGTTVVSANNEAIGDVNDVVVDRDGRALAVVIGVGGFLGIGEKDVAVQMSALEFRAGAQPAQGGSGGNQQSSANTNTGGSTMPATEATGSTVQTTSPASRQQNQATNRATASTGNTGNSGPNTGASAASGTQTSNGGSPDRIVLRMSKSELEAAPAFRTRSGDSSAPRQ
jgi:hypothetical protein